MVCLEEMEPLCSGHIVLNRVLHSFVKKDGDGVVQESDCGASTSCCSNEGSVAGTALIEVMKEEMHNKVGTENSSMAKS